MRTQLEFPLMARIDAPSAVPTYYVQRVRTYREAVRWCWAHRRVRNMTQRALSAEADLLPQHVTDYLHPDDRPTRRDLPARCVAQFESVCGNTFVSQWLARQGTLTVLEEMQAMRQAA